MKKFTYKLILIIIAFSLTGCLGSKKVSDSSLIIKQSDKTEINNDSSNVTNTNRAIYDRFYTPIPSTGNAEFDSMIDDILLRLNTSKQSGTNSYNQTYNPQKRQIETDFTIGETKDVKIDTNKKTTTEKSFEQTADEYVYKKITTLPWWAYVIAAFFLRSHIVAILSFFIPGLTGIKTIRDLKTNLTPKIRSPVQD